MASTTRWRRLAQVFRTWCSSCWIRETRSTRQAPAGDHLAANAVDGQGSAQDGFLPRRRWPPSKADLSLLHKRYAVVTGGNVWSTVRRRPFQMSKTGPGGEQYRHAGGVYRIKVS